MAGRVDNIDTITVPLKRRVLRPNGNALLALEIHRVHHPLLDFLIRPKSPRLTQQLVDQGCLTVVYVRNDGNVTDLFHERVPGRGGARNMPASAGKSNPMTLKFATSFRYRLTNT